MYKIILTLSLLLENFDKTKLPQFENFPSFLESSRFNYTN